MKFMVTWKIAPAHQREAGRRFLDGGAPPPDGMRILGRWHAPGSAAGFALCETDDLALLWQIMERTVERPGAVWTSGWR